MKTGYRNLASVFGALLLGLICAPSSWASCVPAVTGVTHSSWNSQRGGAALLLAEEDRYHAPSIVGFWHFKQTQGINVFDAGYEHWHSDGTELYVSGLRPPDTGDVCMGVWEQVGPRHYRLNHRAIGWVSGGTTPAYVAAILEDVILSPDGNCFNGTYIVKVYDLTGHLLQVLSSGKVTGDRVTVADAVPGALE